MNPPSAPERVLITGASSGLGVEFARLFAAEGGELVLTARRGDRLEALAAELRASGATVTTLEADLAAPGAGEALADALGARGLAIDVLVNNAGFGARRPFTEVPLADQLEMIRLNVEAVVALTGRLVPGMRERGRGGILNVASTAAFQAGPGMAVYYATKAFVLSFSEALHEELKGDGLAVSALCPGPTATPFSERAGRAGSALLTRFKADPAAVARFGHRAFRRNRAVAIPGLGNRFGAVLAKLAPRSLSRRVAKRLQ
ncbi:MAG: SDR family oxidoreductase [Planctomycetota bacterium]